MKRFILVSGLLAMLAVMTGCLEKDPVSIVQDTTMEKWPEQTIGEVFKSSFNNGKWTQFNSTQGDTVVEFTGTISPQLRARALNVELAVRALYILHEGDYLPAKKRVRAWLAEQQTLEFGDMRPDWRKYIRKHYPFEKQKLQMYWVVLSKHNWKEGDEVQFQWVVKAGQPTLAYYDSLTWKGLDSKDVFDCIYGKLPMTLNAAEEEAVRSAKFEVFEMTDVLNQYAEAEESKKQEVISDEKMRVASLPPLPVVAADSAVKEIMRKVENKESGVTTKRGWSFIGRIQDTKGTHHRLMKKGSHNTTPSYLFLNFPEFGDDLQGISIAVEAHSNAEKFTHLYGGSRDYFVTSEGKHIGRVCFEGKLVDNGEYLLLQFQDSPNLPRIEQFLSKKDEITLEPAWHPGSTMMFETEYYGRAKWNLLKRRHSQV